MKDFQGRTAVVTGASSGIGLALAGRLAAEGMNVVMADIERDALEKAAKAVGAGGAKVVAVPTDVSNAQSVADLAAASAAAFGKVHVLCANAGVASYGSVWDQSLDDWQWTLGVNLWGVVHTLRSFVPAMLAHGEEGHVVVTASSAGLLPMSSSAYGASKAAVMALTEGMVSDLAGTRIGVSVLCPGGVKTRIFESERNRPAALSRHGVLSKEMTAKLAALASPDRTDQMTPVQIADMVAAAIRDNQLYVLPMQPQHLGPIRKRLQKLLQVLDETPAA